MKNNQENLQSIYKSFQLPKNDERLEKLKDSAYSKVLVITEDWCGDAMMNIPILKHISEKLNIEARAFHRDDELT
ncbi:Thioredoxin [Staphylococcus saccharolyticus]|uniref:Thioredoxin n=1 Tax=Staphylococcus saccharolyticus TaxID=33028 RepID=A0A380H324_9STAP|nr:Thioredoxin [Staphylococcus saccharolyticus]